MEKTCEFIKVKNDEELRKPSKRGRAFGYAHKDSTRRKMSERLKITQSTDKVRKRTQKVMSEYYDKKKITILQKYDISGDVDDYVKPVKQKGSENIHDYVIRIAGKKLSIDSKDQSLEMKYDKLKSIILKVKELQQNNAP